MTTIEKFMLLKRLLESGSELIEVVDDAIAELNQRHFSDSDFRYLMFAYNLERGMGDREGAIIGPYQFSEIAWSEAGEGDWRTNALDPVLSARAALRFREINRFRFRRHFPRTPYSDEIAYLFHNQGPSAAIDFLHTGNLRFPRQSDAALAVFNQIKV